MHTLAAWLGLDLQCEYLLCTVLYCVTVTLNIRRSLWLGIPENTLITESVYVTYCSRSTEYKALGKTFQAMDFDWPTGTVQYCNSDTAFTLMYVHAGVKSATDFSPTWTSDVVTTFETVIVGYCGHSETGWLTQRTRTL